MAQQFDAANVLVLHLRNSVQLEIGQLPHRLDNRVCCKPSDAFVQCPPFNASVFTLQNTAIQSRSNFNPHFGINLRSALLQV